MDDGNTLNHQTASDFFAERIPEYDSLMRRAVSGYEAMTSALLAELPPAARNILELGCGTGNLTLQVAARYPAAVLTLVDGSAEMVALTRHRLEVLAPRQAREATFITNWFEAVDFADGSFDLITSAIALHHVADKGPLYRQMHRWLKPGGRLCFADQLRMQDPGSQAHHWAEFLAFWRRPGNVSETEIVELLAHSEAHDHYETLADQFALLRAAGFRDLDAPWRDGFWAVLTATA